MACSAQHLKRWRSSSGEGDAGARTPLGSASSRNLCAAEYKTQLAGAPAAEYVVVHYDSAFEKKGTAREIVTLPKQTDSTWKVAGYFVQ